MQKPMLTPFDLRFALTLADEWISHRLGLPLGRWPRVVAVSAVPIIIVVVWHGQRYGWSHLVDMSLATKSFWTFLISSAVTGAVEWALFHAPYEPRPRRPNDMWQP